MKCNHANGLNHQTQALNANTKRYYQIQAPNSSTKRYHWAQAPNASTNGGDASRVGIEKVEKNTKSTK